MDNLNVLQCNGVTCHIRRNSSTLEVLSDLMLHCPDFSSDSTYFTMEYVACRRWRLPVVSCAEVSQQTFDVKDLIGAAIFCGGMSAKEVDE